jgi:hypothetical protein
MAVEEYYSNNQVWLQLEISDDEKDNNMVK